LGQATPKKSKQKAWQPSLWSEKKNAELILGRVWGGKHDQS